MFRVAPPAATSIEMSILRGEVKQDDVKQVETGLNTLSLEDLKSIRTYLLYHRSRNKDLLAVSVLCASAASVFTLMTGVTFTIDFAASLPEDRKKAGLEFGFVLTGLAVVLWALFFLTRKYACQNEEERKNFIDGVKNYFAETSGLPETLSFSKAGAVVRGALREVEVAISSKEKKNSDSLKTPLIA